jgi:dTDP-4-dehydrorhamnose 3,5-epimerase
VAGTLRGFHYQLDPNAETKLIRCFRGAIYDVIVDLRPDSPTYLQHFGAELTAGNRTAMYVPRNFAHAYLTLTDDTEVIYQVSTAYTPGAERGLHYDDPALGVQWPVEVTKISEKDAAWPLLSEQAVDLK